jgi:hypothetical protein
MFSLTREAWSELRHPDPVWDGPFARGCTVLLLPLFVVLDILALPVVLLGMAATRILVRWC